MQALKNTLKYTMVSLLATVADFVTFFTLTNIGQKEWYIIFTMLGMLAGGIISWLMHKFWVYSASQVPQQQQRLRYALGFILSVLLNMLFMYICIEWLAMPTIWARIVSSLLVWVIIYIFNSFIVFKVDLLKQD